LYLAVRAPGERSNSRNSAPIIVLLHDTPQPVRRLQSRETFNPGSRFAWSLTNAARAQLVLCDAARTAARTDLTLVSGRLVGARTLASASASCRNASRMLAGRSPSARTPYPRLHLRTPCASPPA